MKKKIERSYWEGLEMLVSDKFIGFNQMLTCIMQPFNMGWLKKLYFLIFNCVKAYTSTLLVACTFQCIVRFLLLYVS